MIKLPNITTYAEPKESKILSFKNSTLFLISLLAEILNISLNLLNHSKLDIKINIIIILSITCIILFVDIIVLYLKDRENYYKNTYLTNMYYLLTDNVKDLQQSVTNLEDKIS